MSTTARPTSEEARLARLGLGGEALPVLRRLGLDLQSAAPLTAGPDPPAALRALERLAERSPSLWKVLRWRSPSVLERWSLLAGTSEALAELTVTDQGLVAVLTGALAPHGPERAESVASAILRHAGIPAARALARAQRRGLARVALRDVLGEADTPAIAGELADLAEGVLQAALTAAQAEVGTPARLAVIAMGKLGGRELNYVSDVDVLFVGDGDLRAATRVAEMFLRLVGTVTPEGRAYEVDAALRPEGRDGALVRTLDGYRAYYERWAANWEFQALLKARPIAGDAELGHSFVELVSPFVWPDRRAADVIGDIQRLKGVVEGSRGVMRIGDREVKLAPGGLRDIEFAVQILQLVHGRHDPTLRARSTLSALAALADGGYVGEEDARTFAEAYTFLRTVEHRLQLRRLRRTHALPAGEEERQRLARSLGYRDDALGRAVERFDADLARIRAEVRRVHEKLFYRPLLGRFAEVGRQELVDERLDRNAVTGRLGALGFRGPDAALRSLEALTRGTSRRARLLRTLLPAVLPALAATPDPDGGLAALRSLAERMDMQPAFLAALRDRPVVAERLVTVLGSSPLVARWLERQPEVLAELADEQALSERRDTGAYRRLAEGLIRRNDSEERVADALRRVARRELARTAIRDLLGLADPGQVSEELSGLAEACLEIAIATLRPADAGLAVIALGRLGGRELGYASDLDVLFVFEPGEARDEALRAAAGLLRLLSASSAEGRVFVVDPNLRPEGKDGPLARTLGSYRTYYERWAEPWEVQALTQARVVAGDRPLGRAFVDVLSGIVYPAAVPAERLEAVREMKRRVETERPRSSAEAGAVDLKLDPGGMTDVEWTVQLLQLAHGGRLPRLRRRGTLPALAACEAEGILDAADAGALREGYALLSRLRNLAYLAGFRDPNRLPPSDDELTGISGDEGPAALRSRVIDLMARVRTVHERIFR